MDQKILRISLSGWAQWYLGKLSGREVIIGVMHEALTVFPLQETPVNCWCSRRLYRKFLRQQRFHFLLHGHYDQRSSRMVVELTLLELISNGAEKGERLYFGGKGLARRRKVWTRAGVSFPRAQRVVDGIRRLIQRMDNDGRLDRWLVRMA